MNIEITTRWTEIEHRIATDPRYAAKYAIKIIQQRWPEAEPAILQGISCAPAEACQYAMKFIGGRWPQFEAIMAQKLAHFETFTWQLAGWACQYADLFDFQWVELERSFVSAFRESNYRHGFGKEVAKWVNIYLKRLRGRRSIVFEAYFEEFFKYGGRGQLPSEHARSPHIEDCMQQYIQSVDWAIPTIDPVSDFIARQLLK